MNLQERSFGNH